MSPRAMNPDYSPLLTDMYQITMGYSYFKQGRHQEDSVFDMFYRKNPFKGLYTLFFGIHEVQAYVEDLKFIKPEVTYILQHLNITDDAFKQYLLHEFQKDVSKVKLHHLPEGTVTSPKIPVIRVEGPLFVCQLIETAALALTGFASLVGTNASRICSAAEGRKVLEFGLRRAQGINGAMTASKYAVLGGCVGTSNVLSGFRNKCYVSGTMAHSYICSFQNYSSIPEKYENHDFTKLVYHIRNFCETGINNKEWKDYLNFKKHNLKFDEAKFKHLTNSELISFIIYAIDYPDNFLALVDTYDTIYSGTINFLYVAFALYLQGNTPKGLRLDSGNLSVLAKKCRYLFDLFFKKIAPKVYDNILKDKALSNRLLIRINSNLGNRSKSRTIFMKKIPKKKGRETAYSIKVNENYDFARSLAIVASNDLHENAVKNLISSQKESNERLEIDLFGIGTHLATCKSEPALGMVYKLTSIAGKPCVKFSQDEIKQTYPGVKKAFRIFLKGEPKGDILTTLEEDLPEKEDKLKLYKNTDFENEVEVEYDEIHSLYEDQIDKLLKVLEINYQESSVQKLLALFKDKDHTKLVKGAVRTKLIEAFFAKMEGMYGKKEMLNEFELLKTKVEARKTIFGNKFLCASTEEDKNLKEYPVYLTTGLRSAVKQSRGH